VDRIFAEIRRASRDLANAEHQNLADGVHLLLDGPRLEETRRLRRQRVEDLNELLSGPAKQAAERAGWGVETVVVRMADLYKAANAVILWDRWDTAYKQFLGIEKTIDHEVRTGQPHWGYRRWQAPSPTGTPRDDLAALLAGMDKALEWVMELAVADPARTESPTVSAATIPDAAATPLAAAVHTPDFASVRVGEAVYTFSPKQRPVVDALWSAWEQGTLWLSHAFLQECADTDGRIVDLFKDHPAWGTLIVKHDQMKDLFGLSMPEPEK
jgi:hypothetical protein